MRYPSDRQEMIGNQGIVGINAGNILDMGGLVNPTTRWGAMWDTRTKKPTPETVPTMGC